MIITGSNETTEMEQDSKSFSESSELNRTFVNMRNNLREDLKDIKNIQW